MRLQMIKEKNVEATSVNGSTVTVKLKATDNVSGITTTTLSGLTIKVNNTAITTSRYSIDTVSGTSTSKTWTITITGFTTGTHSISIDIPANTLTDAKSNKSVAKSYTTSAKVDITAPVWDTNVVSTTTSGATATITIIITFLSRVMETVL